MNIKTILGVVGIVAMFGAGVAIGQWIQKPTLDDLAERNRILAAADTTKEIELSEGRIAYNRLVRDYNDAEQAWMFVNDSLNNVANALRRKAADDGRTIETLVTANAELSDSLDFVLRSVVVTDSVITAHMSTRNEYKDGDISASGVVSIWTPEVAEPWGEASLAFGINMTPTILLSRDELTGLAECDISFGDMPVSVQNLECVNNWDVDLPTRDKIALPSIALGSAITLGVIGLALVVF